MLFFLNIDHFLKHMPKKSICLKGSRNFKGFALIRVVLFILMAQWPAEKKTIRDQLRCSRKFQGFALIFGHSAVLFSQFWTFQLCISTHFLKLNFFEVHFLYYLKNSIFLSSNLARLLVSGRSPECSERLLRFMEQ